MSSVVFIDLQVAGTVPAEEKRYDYASEAQTGAALGEEGEILLYDSDVGAETAGQSSIASFASYAGADVAVSTDLTGARLSGGGVDEISGVALESRDDSGDFLADGFSDVTRMGGWGNETALATTLSSVPQAASADADQLTTAPALAAAAPNVVQDSAGLESGGNITTGSDAFSGAMSADWLIYDGSWGRPLEYGEGGDGIYVDNGDDWTYVDEDYGWTYVDEGDFWIYADNGDYWIYADEGENGTYVDESEDWTYVDEGEDWIYIDDGEDWTYVDESGDWTYVDEGEDWTYVDEGDEWIYIDDGEDWTYVDEGDEWIYIDGGEDWTYLDEGDNSTLVDEDDDLIYDSDDTAGLEDGLGSVTIDGSGVVLDLTVIANSVDTSIEVIDLTGTGNNTLTVALADVLAISTTTDTLRIDGNTGDTVNAGSGWAQGTDQTIGANTYYSYTQVAATLLVDVDITSNVFV